MSTIKAQTRYNPQLSPRSLFDVFFSPGILFEALSEQPKWLLWFVSAAVVPTIGNYVLIRILGFAHVLTDALAASGSVDYSGMIDNAMKHITTIMMIQGISAFLGTWLAILTVALVLLLLLMIVGADVTYTKIVAIVSVAFLATECLHYLIALPVAALSPENFNINRPLITNASYFLVSDNKYVEHLAEAIDSITFVGILLLARGVQIVSRKLSFRSALVMVVGVWGIYIGLKVITL